ncbi:hypothetical protein LTR91_003173 [Friedmanniomyces endolithicus]|uniref:SMODS and SLOG-associating 2TM effector domain-containing protein n=1 Tax=Friedmanniomyces endolithicus TaxID=329885 RepID=A0A4U0TWN1_9PEZI|nr:hypothetical protein LTS09_015051 [Friedmanniomyces endolithicus]KAK0272838.1 hypothetical protein LTS00_016031 [Friedmanniomyces endolithicus]KAK0274207.1 hypothetical protein LTR35_011716 [Friedmanniomyces endolithicus]KAK0311739.1 hypothetical protein LTR82_014111 [Friedmanniomyces endolithicus]KAK0823179.1 hypothetical protein LTR73_008704 [Friedmanniomyces endolithicus]
MSDVGSQLLRTTDSKPLLSLPCKTYGTSSIAHASKASHGVPTLGAVHLADEDGSVIDDMDVAFDDRQPMKPAAFYKLIGLRQPQDASYVSCLAQLEEGSGLYHDIRTNHEYMHRAFYYFELGAYTALLGQILLSANFVVLGAMRGDHHVAIAILGAFSVAIAGILALIKGQGLPMRLRIERDALWEVQLQAEELHWQVAAGKPVMFADVKRIWSRFVQVKREASLNHPDTWNSSTSAASQPIAGLAKLSVPAAAQMPDTAHGPDVAAPVVSTATVVIPTVDGQHV